MRNGRRKHKRHGWHYKEQTSNFDIVHWEKLEYLAEDILRMMAEREQNLTPFGDLAKVCTNSKKLGRILDILEMKALIHIFEDHIELTEEGVKISRKILAKHQALEKAFDFSVTNLSTHKIAHILEHTISDSELENVVKISQNSEQIQGYSLFDYQLPAGIVQKLTFDSENLFYKLLSLGIYPGQRIEILQRTGYNQVIKVKNSRFVVDARIAQNIFVSPE